ncbi:bifunctional transcriptional activator/DNA repair enzyme AdaA [Paenibacillus sp. GCM10027627]|uniref:bifunctional transcriptional activator/DNA repair enzyme AdaA n=1 Tax=unclassified Paenibacillus TaxID=185978 RepID=UPI003625B1C0
MTMKRTAILDSQWEAILANDRKSDGLFYYAVRTTGIYCRPSCKSRPPKRDHVAVFPTSADATSAGFRPCKRCKPGGGKLPDEEWAIQISAFIDRNYKRDLTLAIISESCHGSPYHLHRTFKKRRGVTPLDYLQTTRIEAAKELLQSSDSSISEIGEAVGMRSAAYFSTIFKKRTGMTPAQYRALNDLEEAQHEIED